MQENYCMLNTFAACIFLVFVLEIGTVAAGFVLKLVESFSADKILYFSFSDPWARYILCFRDAISETVTDGMETSIAKYEEKPIQSAWDFIQVIRIS